MDKSLEFVFRCFGNELYNAVKNIPYDFSEVRIRSDKPVIVYIKNMPYLLHKSGELSSAENFSSSEFFVKTDFSEIKNAFTKLCDYSVYKHQNDINNGFITVCGGHRIGICGTAVVSSAGIKAVTDITSMNIRVAKQFIGCSGDFFNRIDLHSGGVLICGVPSSGKTTMLRDISRTLTLTYCKKVSVIDERSEISALFNGKSSFDLGLSDIYCGYPKDKAVIQAIRTMSPDFIVCDELTGSDLDSVTFTVNYGVKLIATVHCDSLNNALKNPSIRSIIKTGAFQKIVFLDRKIPCKINEVYNSEDIKCD